MPGRPGASSIRAGVSARLSHLGKWVGVSCGIGFVSGVVAVAFDRLLKAFTALAFGGLVGPQAEGVGSDGTRAWWLLLLLPLGGLVVGWLARFAPEA